MQKVTDDKKVDATNQTTRGVLGVQRRTRSLKIFAMGAEERIRARTYKWVVYNVSKYLAFQTL